MQGEINLLINIATAATKSMLRDYFELENLQSTSFARKGIEDFVNKTGNFASKIMMEKLSKFYQVTFASDFDNISTTASDGSKKHAVILPIEGTGNFARAIPFFGLAILVGHQNDDRQFIAEKIVINLPAISEVYHAETGKGAYIHRYVNGSLNRTRVRVSPVQNIETAFISSSSSMLKNVARYNGNIRVSGSFLYDLCQVASGKIDLSFWQLSPILLSLAELVIKESGGGMRLHNSCHIISNYGLLGNNDLLSYL
jgi:myo-inositol-1(or 4)-monophosphatase